MARTEFQQKIALVALGIGLTLVVLEFTLRLGGMVFNASLAGQNRGISFSGDEYRILCLGESTTALGGENSYPFQLEQILNQRGSERKFEVINKGLVSKTSSDILAGLDDNLRRYKPQIVIAMIGVNDPKIMTRQNSAVVKLHNALRHSRVFHLAELLSEHVRSKWEERRRAKNSRLEMDKDTADTADDLTKMNQKLRELDEAVGRLQKLEVRNPLEKEQARQQIVAVRLQQVFVLVGMGKYQRLRGQYQKAEHAFAGAQKLLPNNYGVLVEWSRVYQAQGDYAKALALLERAVHDNKIGVLGRMDLFRCYDKLERAEDAHKLAQNIVNDPQSEMWVYPELGEWLAKHGHLDEAEKAYLKAAEQNPNDAEICQELAEISVKLNKTSQARKYSEKAAAIQKQNESYLPETVQNYNQIVEKVLASGARMVVMQYPLRRISTLKAIFPAELDITFIENRDNFMSALQNDSYPDYFSDSFGGDFGHCTRLGNQLIAGQLADVITERLISKDGVIK